jgi:DNA primase small subunit
MKEKFWKGADLIFDLDADHLRKAPKSYSEMLELVKKETQSS